MTEPTPRTDAEIAGIDPFVTDSDQRATSWTDYECLADFARQLERELAEAHEAIAAADSLRNYMADQIRFGREELANAYERAAQVVEAFFRMGWQKCAAEIRALKLAPEPRKPDHSTALTFSRFREANVKRCVKWHPQGIASWSPSDWLTAVTGELGELASLLKMRNRERDGLPGNKFSPTQKQIADEVADVATYLDLLAAVLGVDLGRAVIEKFNEVSERVGFPDRITETDALEGAQQNAAPQMAHAKAPAEQAQAEEPVQTSAGAAPDTLPDEMPRYPAVWICPDHGGKNNQAEHVRVAEYDTLRAHCERLQSERDLWKLDAYASHRHIREHQDEGCEEQIHQLQSRIRELGGGE